MAVRTKTETIEQHVRIDAPPGDIFALLADLESIPDYCPETTVTPAGDGVEVAYPGDGLGGVHSITFRGLVRLTDVAEPTTLTMTLDGAIRGTVEWTLQPHEGSTLVTAVVTYNLAKQDHKNVIGDTRNEADRDGGTPQSPIVVMLPSIVDEALATLKELCEQPSPPASMVGGEIPAIYCPVPPARNPQLEEATAHSVDWAHEMGLIDQNSPSPKLLAGPSCASWFHPAAPSPEFCLISDWYCWGFLEDDALDPTERGADPAAMKRFQQPLLAVLESGTADESQMPLVRALADISQRGETLGSASWHERFVQHHVDFFAAQRWEAHNRAQTHIPERDTYLPKRRKTSGGYIATDLIALADNSDLPPSLYYRETYQDLLAVTANVASWTNDVYSLRKELVAGEVNNLVVIVRNEQGCSLQDAVTEVCAMIDDETRRFEEKRQRLIDDFDGHEALQTHLTHLGELIAGNLAWSKETARYGSSE